jgi:hypothetical protein
MTDRHLDTSAGVLRFCELRRREMAEGFTREGRFEVRGQSFAGYVFATHEVGSPPSRGAPIEAWKVGAKRAHVEAIPVYLPEWAGALIEPHQATELFSQCVRQYTRLTRAIGTLVMSEIWTVRLEGDREQAKAARDALPRSLEDADNRRESLFMMLEHSATGQRQWWSAIKRNPTRLEPWTEAKMDDAEGRLIGLSNYQS